MIATSRRGFLTSLTGFVACAPAIVRVESLMKLPVRAIYPAYGRSLGMAALADVRELQERAFIASMTERFTALLDQRLEWTDGWGNITQFMVPERGELLPI
jgi:hypothetical protein